MQRIAFPHCHSAIAKSALSADRHDPVASRPEGEAHLHCAEPGRDGVVSRTAGQGGLLLVTPAPTSTATCRSQDGPLLARRWEQPAACGGVR